MLRLAGTADKQGKLYPDDVKSRLEIDQLLGLVGDFARAWRPVGAGVNFELMRAIH